MSDCQASGATRNEDKPDPCEVKLNKGMEKTTMRTTAVLLASMIIGAAVLTGCVSIEDQLNSQDPNVRLQGEHRLLTQARLSGKPEEVLNAVKRIQTKPLLLEIAKNANQKRLEEGQAALSKLTDEKDFATLTCSAESPQIRRMAFAKVSQQKTLRTICTQTKDPVIRKSAMDKLSPADFALLPYSPELLPYWKKITDQKTLAKIYRDGCGTFSEDDLKAIADKINDAAVLGEMVIPPDPIAERKRDSEIRAAKSTLQTLEKMQQRERKSDRRNAYAQRSRQAENEAMAKLQRFQAEGGSLYVTNDAARTALYCRIQNAEVFGKIVSATDEYNRPLFKTREQLAPILKRMPEDKALEFVLGKLEGYRTDHWNRNEFWPLEVAVSLAGVAKDSKTRVRLADATFGKIESIKDECRNSHNFGVSWNDKDKSTAAKYVAEFPLSEDEKAEILAIGSLAGRRVAEIAGEETARKALASGRSFGRELEEQLVAKIPANKIDILLYESVKPGTAKAALYEKMPENMKYVAKASLKRSFAAVEAKAKAAASGTFELAGFYLGMSLDDLETVLAYHFPRLEFSECRDEDGYEKEKGFGKEFMIVFSSKNNPFCRASAKDRKVYRIDFDKDIIANWCKYNAATPRTWAQSFGKEHGVKMEYSPLSKEVTAVSGNNMSFRQISLHQETWQCKNVAKKYRLTYFGKPEIIGGMGRLLGGDGWEKLCREGAAPEGTFRAEIED